MPRTLLFDIDGTLFDRDLAYRQYCQAFAARCVSDVQERKVLSSELVRRDILASPSQENTRWLADKLGGQNGSDAVVARFRRGFLDSILPDDRLVKLLRRLGRRFRLGVVSNGAACSQQAKLRRLGLVQLISGVFFSNKGYGAKPSAAIFRRAIRWANCPPEEILVIGDDPHNDVVGPAALSLQTCWVSRNKTYPRGLPRPEFVVSNVLELEGVLR